MYQFKIYHHFILFFNSTVSFILYRICIFLKYLYQFTDDFIDDF